MPVEVYWNSPEDKRVCYEITPPEYSELSRLIGSNRPISSRTVHLTGMGAFGATAIDKYPLTRKIKTWIELKTRTPLKNFHSVQINAEARNNKGTHFFMHIDPRNETYTIPGI